MQKRTITISKSARYFYQGEPGAHVKEIWLACHGYGQSAESFLKNFSSLDDGTRLVVAPEGLSRFYISGFNGRIGASWMTREDRENEISDYIAYLDAVCAEILNLIEHQVDRIVSFGFSQGGATASRWAAGSVFSISRLIVWGSTLPPEYFDSPGNLNSIPITLCAGSEDPLISEARLLSERQALEKSGLNFEIMEYEGGHEIYPETLHQLTSTNPGR